MSSLLNCLFHTRQILHVLTGFYLGFKVHKGEVKIKAWPYPTKRRAELNTPEILLNFGKPYPKFLYILPEILVISLILLVFPFMPRFKICVAFLFISFNKFIKFLQPCNLQPLIIIFFNVGPLKESIFLATTYGLYFSFIIFIDYISLWSTRQSVFCGVYTNRPYTKMFDETVPHSGSKF